MPGAVELRRLPEIVGQSQEELPHQEDPEDRGAEGNDLGLVAVDPVQVGEDDEVRDQRDLGRDHVDGEDDQEDDALAGERHRSEGVAGQHRGDQHQRRGSARHDDRVQEVARPGDLQELSGLGIGLEADRHREVLPVPERVEDGREHEHRLQRPQRDDQHPVEGEDEEGGEQDQDRVARHQLEDADAQASAHRAPQPHDGREAASVVNGEARRPGLSRPNESCIPTKRVAPRWGFWKGEPAPPCLFIGKRPGVRKRPSGAR